MALKVLVVGAGVVGRCVAYHLALRDVHVQIIDAGPGNSSTTRASLGVLTHFNGSANPYSDLYRDGHAAHEELAGQLQAETGVDIGWRPLGGVDLIFTDEDEEAAAQLIRFNQERGCPAERIDAANLRRLEPQISPRARGGLYFPGDHQVDPEKLAQGLLQATEQRGGAISYGEALEDFEEVTAGGVVVRTRSGKRSADFLVLAAGSWSGELGQRLGVRIPVRPVRGQHSRYSASEMVHHVLRHRGHHLVPAAAQIIVGATAEEVGFEVETTPAAARCFERIFRHTLAMEPQPVEQRAGLRPKPRGGRPLIGPLSAHPRIFAATGHYKNGILLGPITGQLISEWIVEGRPSRDMSYFSVSR